MKVDNLRCRTECKVLYVVGYCKTGAVISTVTLKIIGSGGTCDDFRATDFAGRSYLRRNSSWLHLTNGSTSIAKSVVCTLYASLHQTMYHANTIVTKIHIV